MTTTQVFYPSRILSSANSTDLLKWVQTNLESGSNQLLINLKSVIFMDSTGLGTLVTALKMVRESGGQLSLCSLNGQARMLFEMTGMEKVFEIYNSVEEFNAATV